MQHAPGPAAPLPSQINSIVGNKMQNAAAPSPPPQQFMPVTGSGVVQGPGTGAIQPPRTAQPTPVQPSVTTAIPPPTIQTVDTSNISGN